MPFDLERLRESAITARAFYGDEATLYHAPNTHIHEDVQDLIAELRLKTATDDELLPSEYSVGGPE